MYYEAGYAARLIDPLFDKDEIPGDFNTNEFDYLEDNPFLRPRENPLSTFSIDVDTAGYSIVRTFINRGDLPPKSSVRIEVLINYFDYDYPPPNDGRPFAVRAEAGVCPDDKGSKGGKIS
ncbi:MAG: von Willebrand factor type A domain-containing protein [Treponema sp.]|nr:von Willebrand factor type A domain-containing protein [Treponema sp.]